MDILKNIFLKFRRKIIFFIFKKIKLMQKYFIHPNMIKFVLKHTLSKKEFFWLIFVLGTLPHSSFLLSRSLK